jgi:2,4-diketo-3-deoxy-L-fuconate hydrolase
MRLVGIRVDDRPWVGVEVSSGVAPVASVDTFYSDVEAHLEIARAKGANDGGSYPAAVPVPESAKVLCAGLNYVNHAAESNKELPKHPDVFARWASTLVATGVTVPLPTNEPGLDWEGELAAVIGVSLKDATPAEVEAGVLGYTALNDLSARIHQRATGQWTIGKNADLSAPIGPAIVTSDEISDPYSLKLETRVDGEVMQSTITGEMLFRIGQIGAYASETMTLRPGDVISTGTPQGVGSARKPAIFLTTGQVVEIEIESIGILSTPIGAQTSRGAAASLAAASEAVEH